MTELLLRQSDLDLGRVAGRLVARDAIPAAEAHAPALAVRPGTLPALLAFDIVRDTAGLDALGPEWDALFEAVGRPEQLFQRHAWIWHWSRHYLAGRHAPSLAIVTGRLDGRLVLVMPLVVTRRLGLRQLTWAGEPVSQYGDVIAAPEASQPETLVAAWAYAVATTRADVANLRKVRADAAVAPLLCTLGAEITATDEAPCIDLTIAGGHAAWEASLTAKSRKNRRRHMRRLEERGPVTFETHSGNDDAAALAAHAIVLKRAWLDAKDRISLALADDRFVAFFADVAHGRGRPVGAQVSVLRSNGELAAMHVAFECGASRFLHVAVYAPKFEKNGVGALLLEHAAAECGNAGIGTFDLLAPRYAYKMDFTDRTVVVHDHALALTAAGRAYAHGWLGVRRRVKSAIEALPAPARRAVAAAMGLMKRR